MNAVKWGYKGRETALNGLLIWIQDLYELRGTSEERLNFCFRIIVEWGKENIPTFKNIGHLSSKADYVAKKIQGGNNFDQFAEWVLKNKYKLPCQK